MCGQGAVNSSLVRVKKMLAVAYSNVLYDARVRGMVVHCVCDFLNTQLNKIHTQTYTLRIKKMIQCNLSIRPSMK